jgi:hypothetical protein
MATNMEPELPGTRVLSLASIAGQVRKRIAALDANTRLATAWTGD